MTTPHYTIARGSLPPTTNFHIKLLEGFALLAQLEAIKLRLSLFNTNLNTTATEEEIGEFRTLEDQLKERKREFCRSWTGDIYEIARMHCEAYCAAHAALNDSHPEYQAKRAAFYAGSAPVEAYEDIESIEKEEETILTEGLMWHQVKKAIVAIVEAFDSSEF